MKTIAALLTIYNRKNQTMCCLKSLFCQEIPDGYSLEVYLTDDGCTDGSAEAIREAYPQVHIINGNGSLFWNRGMWTAWNAASRTSNYDYYLWLNDDTCLFNGAMSALLATSKNQMDKSIIIGATVDACTHTSLTYGGIKDNKIAPCNGTDIEVDHFNGNIVLVPQHAYGVLGNLDYYYIHSKGDFDYGIRARKAGIKMIQAGTALGECDLHPNIDKWCDPQLPFLKRWQLMQRPNGMLPRETFHLEKQINLPMAIVHYFTVYLRCMFPQMWIKHK